MSHTQELLEALKRLVAADDGGWATRHAAENTYCPDCANDSDAWRDQEEHHAGCAYVARMEAARAAIAKAENKPEGRYPMKCDCQCHDVNKGATACSGCECKPLLLIRDRSADGGLREARRHRTMNAEVILMDLLRLTGHTDGQARERAHNIIAGIVAAERERCARIADGFVGCENIASAIRAGGK